MVAATVVAVIAVCAARTWLLAAAVIVTFFSGGVLLAGDAWQRAWRPSLRVPFDDLARRERAAADRRLPEDDEASATVEGRVRADASPTQNGISLSIDVDAVASDAGCVSVTGGVQLTVIGETARDLAGDWRAGRRVRAPARLHRATRYLDPGVPDFERALARRGTTLVGTVKSGALVQVIALGSRWDEALASARAHVRDVLNANVGHWSAQSSAIVTAIVLGDRSALDPDVERSLQEAGTYHVIAISGGNIAILAGALLGAFTLAGAAGRAPLVSTMAVLIAYARLVGGGASVTRATWMALVACGVRLVDHRSPPINILIVVLAALVLANPLAVADAAFLLTFGATGAILLIAPSVARMSTHRWLALVIGMLAASCAAELALLPIAVVLFSRVTFAGLALNFLAIPMMTVAQIAGMAVVPIAAISPRTALAIGWIAHIGASGLVWSADLVRFVPFVTWRVAPPPFLACAIYYIAIGVTWVLITRRVDTGEMSMWARTGAASCAAAFAGATLWILVDPRTLIAPRGDGRLHATYIDVGQGDAIFVTFPRGSTLLVDAGGLGFGSSFDIGDRVVAPVIRHAGFRRIDRLALTHGDPDHIGGALAILREFRPREIWEGVPVPRFAPLDALRSVAASFGARWANVYEGSAITIDGVEVISRHPPPPDWERRKVRNDDSLVLELRWRDVSILLTGDVGHDAELMLPMDRPLPLRVVKIPHHGSLSSSSRTFVERWRPQLAIVSAGRSNHFGHPATDVLQRYDDVGATVFRTDRDGAVQLDTDGISVTVSSFTGRRRTWSADEVSVASLR